MDTNIVHESMGLTSPGLYFMWRKRLLMTNGVWDGGWARRGEDESPICILFHFEEARVSIFYFRVRAFFLANDWDNLSGIEWFFWFPLSPLELRTVWSSWAKLRRLWLASFSSWSSGICFVCLAVSLCRWQWSRIDSQRMRVRQGLLALWLYCLWWRMISSPCRHE